MPNSHRRIKQSGLCSYINKLLTRRKRAITVEQCHKLRHWSGVASAAIHQFRGFEMSQQRWQLFHAAGCCTDARFAIELVVANELLDFHLNGWSGESSRL
jgi:hypothetical protein